MGIFNLSKKANRVLNIVLDIDASENDPDIESQFEDFFIDEESICNAISDYCKIIDEDINIGNIPDIKLDISNYPWLKDMMDVIYSFVCHAEVAADDNGSRYISVGFKRKNEIVDQSGIYIVYSIDVDSIEIL